MMYGDWIGAKDRGCIHCGAGFPNVEIVIIERDDANVKRIKCLRCGRYSSYDGGNLE
jgi:ribosomal protein S27AE